MAFDTTQVFASVERLENRKRQWYPTWQDIADYVIPRKGNFFYMSPGMKRTGRIFEATAPHSNELLAASLQGSLTSPVIQWFTLRLREEEANQDRLVRMWLDSVSRVIYSMLSHSNFNSEIFETYLDLGSFGTASLFIEEMPGPGFNGIMFDSLDIGEYVFDENKEGYVDTHYRTFPLSARQAVDFFGADVSKLSDKIIEAAKSKPEERFDFLHAVIPRKVKDRRGFGGTRMPWASLWYEKRTKSLIREEGYAEFPFAVPRWLKTSGELWGRSPSHTAMPDIRSLNKARQLLFRAWGKSIDPPIKVLDDGVIGSVKLTPSGLNVVRDMAALDTLRNEGRFDVSNLEEEKLRQSIRRMYFTDQLQLQQGGPQMTATEVQIRFELMQRLLGPTFGRMMSELLSPIIHRVFGILMRNGMLPPPPPTIMRSGSASIEIEYEGPLSRAQRSQDILAVERWFQVNAPLLQVDPEVVDVINRDQIAADTAKVIGMRPTWLHSKEELDQIRKQRAQQKQAAAQAEVAKGAAEAAGKAAPMVKAVGDNPDAVGSLQRLLTTGV